MHQLPETGYLRLLQIIGNPKAKSPIPAVISVSKSTWWAGVKSGRYPQPVRTLQGLAINHYHIAIGHYRVMRLYPFYCIGIKQKFHFTLYHVFSPVSNAVAGPGVPQGSNKSR